MAYDRIMDFPGRFREHILPEKIHILNVSFVVNGVKENFGGTAGNIVYNLALLDEKPVVLAVAGDDFLKYEKWLEGRGIDCSKIKKIKGALTAGAYIMTDQDDNQITGFYPGPLDEEYPREVEKLFISPSGIVPAETLAIIAPEYTKRMMAYVRIYKKFGVPYIFDPGQQITALTGEELQEAISGAKVLIGNDYEIQMILDKLKTSPYPLLVKEGELTISYLAEIVKILVITKGAEGSEIYHRSEKIIIPSAKPKNTFDPTGAGDAYRAGFVKGLIEGWPLEKTGRFAGLIACCTIEKYGTQTHDFTWDELQKRYEENFGERLLLKNRQGSVER